MLADTDAIMSLERGRMPEPIVGRCWNCAREMAKPDYGREAVCPACGKPVHVCRNCRYHALGRPNACLEPMVELVVDKTRANFCELFEPSLTSVGQTAAPDVEALRRAAEDLFKS